MSLIKKFRNCRSEKLEKAARAAAKIGIRADHVTGLSLFSGILAIYFLFSSYYAFAAFAMLHLICDGFDGVVARVTKPTRPGKYFDLLTDSTVAFIALAKVAWRLQEPYAFIAAGLYFIALLIHLRSRLQAPMTFMRTASIIVLVIATHPLFPYTDIILTAGYLTAGGVSLFSLARQLQWRMQHG